MPVQEKTLSSEEKQQQAESQAKSEEALAQDIVKSLDLSTGLIPEENEEQPIEATAEVTDESQPTDEVSIETPAETEQQSEEESDEELIPKSKVQKRIDELVRKQKQYEAELTRLKTQKQESTPVKDPDLEKLEKMSEADLKNLKKQVRIAQIRASSDDAKVAELMELEDKVDSVISSSPTRFQDTQVNRFYEAVNSSDVEETIKNDIFGYAKQIFSSSPALRKDVNGQAEAWNLALEHYKQLSKLSVGKSKVNELEQKVNTFKKKTSLDTAVQKGNSKLSEESRVFNKAKISGASFDDKVAFLKRKVDVNQFIPEEFRT